MRTVVHLIVMDPREYCCGLPNLFSLVLDPGPVLLTVYLNN
uniref:Uncharacterized protein n=1 Tax=Lepeophtheirus salmonis TaxID=72036 RepID=A0A0K2UT78_LEPSM